MELHHGGEVEIRYPISIGEHEGLVVREPVSESFQPSAGLRVESGVDEVNGPGGPVPASMKGGCSRCQIDGDIVVDRVEVQKVLLDHFRAVAKGDDELVDTVRRGCS
jgi:hypothetical protein